MTLPAPPAPVWTEREAPTAPVLESLVSGLQLPRALCGVLAARGMTQPEAARRFLRPSLDGLHDPAGLAGAEKAASRLARAIAAGETIFVHGDYDVDGVASTALLTRGLRDMGATVVPFVPHRLRDGYDLSGAGVEAARAAGAAVLLTCDSGIRAHEAVRSASSRGMDVVVTDHHTPADTLPPAHAVVNPRRSDCTYPDKDLCGAGVAFKLLQLVARMLGRDPRELLPLLDLVALATVADLVPLRGENRILVRFGLRYLAHTERPGLRALLAVGGLEDLARSDALDAGHLGWVLAPRINAVGRMGDADDALRLLLTEDPHEARTMAGHLDRLNDDRKTADRGTLDEALELLEADFDPQRDFGVVLAREGWHPGVIGIVASRVVERIHRPVVMISLDNGAGRGSARSIPGLDLFDALSSCSEHLGRFGGHRQAAGMDVAADRVAALRQSFNEAVRLRLDSRVPPPVLRPDLELRPGEVTDKLHHWLEYLGPFGMGNPRPIFVLRGAAVQGKARTVGRGHLKLRVDTGGSVLEAIGFDLAGRVPPEAVGTRADLVFQLRTNEFRGRVSLQARLKDLRPA